MSGERNEQSGAKLPPIELDGGMSLTLELDEYRHDLEDFLAEKSVEELEKELAELGLDKKLSDEQRVKLEFFKSAAEDIIPDSDGREEGYGSQHDDNPPFSLRYPAVSAGYAGRLPGSLSGAARAGLGSSFSSRVPMANPWRKELEEHESAEEAEEPEDKKKWRKKVEGETMGEPDEELSI
ncbi:hypothetical protein N9W34_03990 [Rickettsiales bacterium]|nr:hypothetical protein [Rickettsiales bacterium]